MCYVELRKREQLLLATEERKQYYQNNYLFSNWDFFKAHVLYLFEII